MSGKLGVEDKVYAASDGGKLSIMDMLGYFEKHGVMRVSDLHIKVGAQPAYRIDGELVNLKGPAVTQEIAEGLVYPLMDEKHIAAVKDNSAVDCSYQVGRLQFRINVFMDNDGMSAAIRALGLDIPRPEEIGFPNDI